MKLFPIFVFPYFCFFASLTWTWFLNGIFLFIISFWYLSWIKIRYYSIWMISLVYWYIWWLWYFYDLYSIHSFLLLRLLHSIISIYCSCLSFAFLTSFITKNFHLSKSSDQYIIIFFISAGNLKSSIMFYVFLKMENLWVW